jgi:hypothetical protein
MIMRLRQSIEALNRGYSQFHIDRNIIQLQTVRVVQIKVLEDRTHLSLNFLVACNHTNHYHPVSKFLLANTLPAIRALI